MQELLVELNVIFLVLLHVCLKGLPSCHHLSHLGAQLSTRL